MNEETVIEIGGVEDSPVVHQGKLDVREVEPWEKHRRWDIRREQEFLHNTPTHEGAIVEMNRGRYVVQRDGWRKISS